MGNLGQEGQPKPTMADILQPDEQAKYILVKLPTKPGRETGKVNEPEVIATGFPSVEAAETYAKVKYGKPGE